MSIEDDIAREIFMVNRCLEIAEKRKAFKPTVRHMFLLRKAATGFSANSGVVDNGSPAHKLLKDLSNLNFVDLTEYDKSGSPVYYALTDLGYKLIDDNPIIKTDMLKRLFISIPQDDMTTLKRKRDNAVKGILSCLATLLIIILVMGD